MLLRPLALGLALASLASLVACSGTVKGTGTSGGTSGSSGSSGSSGVDEGTTTGGGTNTSGPTTSTPSDYDALFGPPTTDALTPTTITGLWAGTMSNATDDVRLKIGTSSIVIAVRCSSGRGVSSATTIGMEVAASVSSTSIRLLESKSIGTPVCQIHVRPQTIAACGSQANGEYCFSRTAGGGLYFDTPLFTSDSSSLSGGPDPSFTKLSD